MHGFRVATMTHKPLTEMDDFEFEQYWDSLCDPPSIPETLLALLLAAIYIGAFVVVGLVAR